MDSVHLVILENPEDQAWEKVEELFNRMYGSMQSQGLLLPLSPDGAGKWVRMAKNTAGKFSLTLIAHMDDEIIGFAHGMIKFLPDYLGGHPVGSVTHVFVDEHCRRTGVGQELIGKLEEWFLVKKVHSVELQVISENSGAAGFWENLGYAVELQQFRKLL